MKVLLEIGSFENQNYSPKQFSKMAKNKTTREFFVNNTLALLQRYELDGIFLRWLYPVCWFVSIFFYLIINSGNEIKRILRLVINSRFYGCQK